MGEMRRSDTASRESQGELLRAKIQIPKPLSPLITRPSLAEQIRRAVERSVAVLVVGPSGIGKTSALVQWAADETRPLAWVSLDSRDNDPQRLWQHIAGSIAEATGDRQLVHLARSSSPGSDAYVATLADHLVEQGQRPVLVLDEYEHVVNRDIHDRIELLVKSCGADLTTVVVGRVRPPLKLERLLLAGRLNTFGWADLRFDEEETRDLLLEVFGVEITPDQAASLTTATGGWAGGLVLAGSHLRSGMGVTALSEAITKGREEARDYLLENVWRDLPPGIRDFLLDTAVLGRFSVAMADYVRGQEDSARLVDQLYRDGLFLVFEDDSGIWLRYQRMFQHILAQRLEAISPARALRLHKSAAQWHAKAGNPEEAVEHALKARDYRLAVGLLQELFDEYYEHGHLVRLEQWLSALPDEVIRENPRFLKRGLNLWCSLGRFDERDRWSRIQEATDAHRSPIDDMWRLCLPRERGDLAIALRHGRQTLLSDIGLAPSSPIVSTQLRIAVARSLLLAGQFSECKTLLSEIDGLWGGETVPPPLRVSRDGLLGLAAHMSGDRTASNEFGERMEKALAQCHIRPRPRTVSEGVILRAVLAEDATEGARMLEQLVDASPGFGSDRTMKILALLHLASALSDKGEVIAAASRLAEADKELADLASPMGLTDFRNKVAAKVSAKGTVQPKTAILSERELLILQYLRSEMTLREIATDLYLSVNTVKTHARNIYRKLGVASRHQAASLSSMGHPLGSSWSISESTEQASSS